MNTIVNITGLTLKCLETSDENVMLTKKEKRKISARKFYLKNREEVIKRVSKYYLENKEEIKKRQKVTKKIYYNNYCKKKQSLKIKLSKKRLIKKFLIQTFNKIILHSRNKLKIKIKKTIQKVQLSLKMVKNQLVAIKLLQIMLNYKVLKKKLIFHKISK